MLRAIYKAIKAIIAFCTGLAHFVMNLCKSIADFVMMLPKTVGYIAHVIGIFPLAILSLLTLITFILILKAILGRGR